MDNLLNKYTSENPSFRKGVYSDFDADYLYNVVREYKPKTIIDFAPREGRTTSCIINGIIKNLQEDITNIKYYVFEKDLPFLKKIKIYLNAIITKNNLRDVVQIFYDGNIIDSKILDGIDGVDLLFIDANHDYILARWYVETLFKKVKIGGIIHVHDMHYNNNNNGWADVRMKANRAQHTHPDYTDINTMRGLYPTIFEKYFDGQSYIMKYEGDIIEEFFLRNQNNVKMCSTLQISKDNNLFHGITNFNILSNCSMYFMLKKHIS